MIFISNRTKNIDIHFMVTERERDLIKMKMEQMGVSNMGAYLRKIAIDGYVIHLDLADVRELNKLLRNVTNNLNQIARRVNETDNLYQADIEDLQEQYEQLWTKAEGIIRALADIPT